MDRLLNIIWKLITIVGLQRPGCRPALEEQPLIQQAEAQLPTWRPGQTSGECVRAHPRLLLQDLGLQDVYLRLSPTVWLWPTHSHSFSHLRCFLSVYQLVEELQGSVTTHSQVQEEKKLFDFRVNCSKYQSIWILTMHVLFDPSSHWCVI